MGSPDPARRQTILEREAADRDDGERLDVALASWLAEPRSRSQARIEAGEVTVAGEAAAKSRRLRAGERIVVEAPPAAPPPPPPPHVAIRFQDEHLLIVAKPAGLVVHAGAGHGDATLVDALAAMRVPLARAGGSERPGIVHRLDRGTSGLLVVAKTDQAHARLVAALKRREVSREYWALVEGVPDPPRATIDAAIGRHPTRRTTFSVDADGKPAVSHYDVEEALGRAARLTVRLETGRTHQVRVHLSAIGHPVAGDTAYGASARLADELGLSRPALHARRLALTHPITGERVDVEEPLPDDLTGAYASLRGHSPA